MVCRGEYWLCPGVVCSYRLYDHHPHKFTSGRFLGLLWVYHSCNKATARVFRAFVRLTYMDLIGMLVVDAVAFGRTVAGLIIRPYETYRRIIKHGKVGELVFIAAAMVLYFSLASLVKVASFRPFLLTQQFTLLLWASVSGALLSVGCIYVTSRLLRARTTFATVLIAWSYTLIPTILWFLTTSLLYVILPPPRTTSALGITFSLLFLIFSATLLWWKITLCYLTLRFSLKLNLAKSVLVAVLCAPVLAWWAVNMYRWGVFKVPFL